MTVEGARKKMTSVPLEWFRLVPVPMFLLDRRGKIAYCNDAFAELAGYKREELEGAGLDSLLDVGHAGSVVRDMLALYAGRGLAKPFDLMRKTGTAVHADISLTPVYGDAERPETVSHAVGLILDSKPLSA